MLYGKQYEEFFLTEDQIDELEIRTDGNLVGDFQEHLTESMAGATGYNLRSDKLAELVKRIQDSGHGDKEAFAALGETLYLFAEEEARGLAKREMDLA